jgi:hypothetical protein
LSDGIEVVEQESERAREPERAKAREKERARARVRAVVRTTLKRVRGCSRGPLAAAVHAFFLLQIYQDYSHVHKDMGIIFIHMRIVLINLRDAECTIYKLYMHMTKVFILLYFIYIL